MFSVYIALCIHSAGDVTWHRSLISIRGLSRLFMVFICLGFDTGEFSSRSARHQYRKWVIHHLLPKVSNSIVADRSAAG